MKKFTAMSIIILLFVTLISGCQGSGSATTTQAGTTTQADTQVSTEAKPFSGQHFVVALSANYKYFETVIVDDKGNESYEGLDIDILEYMANDMGFTYEINNMPFASLIGTLQAKQADFVISGMSYTDERAESVDFSDKYATAKIGCLVKKDGGINTVADLAGKKVACSAGTNYENIIKSIEGAELVTFDGQAAVTQELLLGRVDACITGGTAVKNISSENPELTYYIIDPNEVDIGNLSTYNMAFPKGSALVPSFNEQIAKMKENGALNELIIKWLGTDYVD